MDNFSLNNLPNILVQVAPVRQRSIIAIWDCKIHDLHYEINIVQIVELPILLDH